MSSEEQELSEESRKVFDAILQLKAELKVELQAGHAELKAELQAGHAELKAELQERLGETREEFSQSIRSLRRRVAGIDSKLERLEDDSVGIASQPTTSLVQQYRQLPSSVRGGRLVHTPYPEVDFEF